MCHRLSAGEPAGSMWEKQPSTKEVLVAPEKNGLHSDVMARLVHPGGSTGIAARDRKGIAGFGFL